MRVDIVTLIEDAMKALLVVWAKALRDANRDPRAEISALFASADVAADEAEDAKFGDTP